MVSRSQRHAPLAAAALRVARDRPFRACGELARRSGLKWMCPRRQRVSPSVAPLTGFRVPALGAPALPAPHYGAGARRQSRWTRTRRPGRTRAGLLRWLLAPGGSPRGAGWGHLNEARSRSRPGGRSRRRERERADGSSRLVSSENRGVRASRWQARERLQELNSNV